MTPVRTASFTSIYGTTQVNDPEIIDDVVREYLLFSGLKKKYILINYK